ncbi:MULTISPECIES: hypothetical protein [Lactobacillales]|uniref:hypothetical protein n=1 Tax=Lactobacillales TaxID=186826 RepID=UPI002FC59275
MKNKYIESMKYGFIVTGMIAILFYIGYCLFKVMGIYFAFLLSSLGVFGLVTLIHWVWNYKDQYEENNELEED